MMPRLAFCRRGRTPARATRGAGTRSLRPLPISADACILLPEASGYKTRKDIEGVLQALEGMQMKNSLAHPQGDKIIRKQDHAGIIDCYISRVENGKFEVKRRIPKEDLATNMPLRHNLSTLPA